MGHENRIMHFTLPQNNHAIYDYIRGCFLSIVSPYNTTFKPDLRSPIVRIVVVIVVSIVVIASEIFFLVWKQLEQLVKTT